ncbi:conserved hypothetical protein [Candidatus Desulfarcum epimagneticum]|uniref:Sulfotransferase family protein n=1 Tax=uncultured Desulfobacteraceae bacterium TaxID=218296 RepID=A0A484HFD0_9BACT|nr:conserved hypothetical protein [uncultured Desulfobacteraceae bacterium]
MFISHKYKVIFVHIQRTGGSSIHRAFQKCDPDLVETLPVHSAAKRTKHSFITDIKHTVEHDIFQNYLKFCVVRNPFDRMVSWYHMVIGKKGDDQAMFKIRDKNKRLNIFFKGIKFLNNANLPLKKNLLNYWTQLFLLIEKSDNKFAIQAAKSGTDTALELKKKSKNFKEFIFSTQNPEDVFFKKFRLNQLDYISDKTHILVDKILRFENLNAEFNNLGKKIAFEGALSQINKSADRKSYESYYDDRTKKMILKRFKKDFEHFGYHF